MNPKKILLLLLLPGLLLTGCATMSANKAPGANLGKIRRLYVVPLPTDGRHINQIIADQLNLMGYQATTGGNPNPPAGVDAIVTYQDKWMWDITMYMIQLDIQIRDPGSQMVLATGESMRPSLQRKSPPEMAREVLQSIFQQP